KAFGETFEDNRWTRYFYDELGIKVVYDLADPIDYDQSILLAMSSGDLPDYFRINNYGNMKSMAEAGVLAEMGPLYDELASPLLKSIVESEGDLVFAPGTFDGKLYGLPAKMPSTNAYVHLFIRQDWLDKLGLSRPETMDEVAETARAFASQDPDGNGQADTIGLCMDNNFLYQSAGVFWAYGGYPANPAMWLEKDGALAYANVQPEIRDGLAWFKAMFDEKLIDQEFGSHDYAKGYEEPIMSGKAGMMFGKHWNAYLLGQHTKEDPSAKWVSIPLPIGTAPEMRIPSNVAVDYFEVATTSAEHPEGLIRMLNAYVDKLLGPNADFDHFFADGDVSGIWNMVPFYALDPMVDLQGYRDIAKADAEGTLDQLTGSGRGFYDFYKKGSTYYWLMFGAGDSCFRFVDQTYPDKMLWNRYVGAPTATMVESWTSMDELLLTSYTKMIQGQMDIGGFDGVIEQWNAMGGRQVTEEINAAAG
ncbi:MAG: extracellular solute-binding protein, partial [Clostridiales bacterium]|nr:extracellular solute-binding protein [Clostridiales bacterium]